MLSGYNAGMKERITLNFDGGSRGNPGDAGIGIVLQAEDGTPILTLGRYIGRATNNFAEYMALIVGLREAKRLGVTKLLVRGDSELIIKQLRGEYRVKSPGLKDLYEQATALLKEFSEVKLEHNLRDQNAMADKLVNLAVDRRAEVFDVDGSLPGEHLVGRVGAMTMSCDKCGSRIEVKRPSTTKGSFTCPCGNTMS